MFFFLGENHEWGSTMPPGVWDGIQPLLVYQKSATKHDRLINTKKFKRR